MFAMYAGGMSTVEMARIFNKEGVKTPSQTWTEKGIRKASPKGDTFVWQHTSMLRMLKNRAYVGDLVQGTYECRKLRSDRRVMDPEKWIITENHHEPIVDRETFDQEEVFLEKEGWPCPGRQSEMWVLRKESPPQRLRPPLLLVRRTEYL